MSERDDLSRLRDLEDALEAIETRHERRVEGRNLREAATRDDAHEALRIVRDWIRELA